MRLKAILNNRNRLTSLKAMVEWLLQFDVEPIILDNDSSYSPLLDWYARCPVDVIRLNENLGSVAPWESGTLAKLAQHDFILSDPDLDLSDIPHDWQQVLFDGLQAFGKPKCGFSLAIDDLPDHFHLKADVINWESQFWKHPVGDRYFDADIDTTFALHRAESACLPPSSKATRTAKPYIARHVPWYLDSQNISAEERYYIEHASSPTFWTTRFRDSLPTSSSYAQAH